MSFAEVDRQRIVRGCWCPELRGKAAIVTGAGGYRGLGRYIALELARQGVNVVLTDIKRDPGTYHEEERRINWENINSVAREIEATGESAALPIFSDVSDPESADQVVAATVQRFGGVDY